MSSDASTRMIQEYFSFTRDLDNLFAESGRQAHVIWRLDGSYGGLRTVSKEIVNPPGGGTEGIWAEPLRLADYVHFHVGDQEHGVVPVERSYKRYTRNVGSSEIFYQLGSHPYLEVTKTVWVPLQRPAIVVEVVLRNVSDRPRDVRVFTELQSRLSVGWPLRQGGRNTAAFDESLHAVVAHDETHPEWAAVCTTSLPVEAFHLGDFEPHLIGGGKLPSPRGGTGEPSRGRSCLEHAVALPADGEVRLAVVVCGSPRSESEALDTAREVMGRLAALRDERTAHYRRLFAETTVLDTPSYVMNKAFLWAKLGTEDFKHFDPRLGFLYFAGYPAYNFYFASDSMLIMRGSLAWGDFEDAKEMLRTIVRYQATSTGRDTKPGEIWHEMSTSGDRISPNFVSFLFPGLLRAFWAWTGDRAFLDEMYPRAKAVLQWGYLMDRDGDGLLENGPEGEMADSASEDRNVERAHYHVQTQWFDALREGVRLAGIVGDAASARLWQETLDRNRPVVDDLYWNERDRSFEETLRPDGCLDTTGKGLPNLDPEMVDEGKAAATVHLLLDEEAYLSDVDAFAERQAFERTFSTHRTYMSWYVIGRGRRALDLYRMHRPEVAHRALEEIAASPFHFTTPGLWPEVWAVDEPSSLRVRGCFHQAWTGSYGYVYPVMDGLVGLTPDAPARALTFDPHVPAHWPRLAVRRVRIGQGTVDLECAQEQGWRRLAVRNTGKEPLSVRLGFALPPMVEIQGLVVSGAKRPLAELTVDTTPTDVHAYVTVTAPAGGTAEAELRWALSALRVELPGDDARPSSAGEPLFLGRARPGASLTLQTSVRNHSYLSVQSALELELPAGWAAESPSRAPLALASGESRSASFAIRVPATAAEGYYTLRLRIAGSAGVHVTRTVYLPVFRALAAAIDAREVARVGKPHLVEVPATGLAGESGRAAFRVMWPKGWQSRATDRESLDVAAGAQVSPRFQAVPSSPGEAEVSVEVSCPPGSEPWTLRHRVRVLPPEKPLVLYSGFLGCPLASDSALEVVNIPANYALRKPHVLAGLLPLADLVLTTDQHDGVLTAAQVESLSRFVTGGGKLFFFCAWSAPWGRGFFDTFGTLAGTAFPDLLPLRMRKGIGHSRAVRLTGDGAGVFGKIAWDTIPAFDHNEAELRPRARLLAESAEGAPLAAAWDVGKGRVLALAIDCFGFESYVEGLSFDFWPEKPRLIRGGVEWLLRGSPLA